MVFVRKRRGKSLLGEIEARDETREEEGSGEEGREKKS